MGVLKGASWLLLRNNYIKKAAFLYKAFIKDAIYALLYFIFFIWGSNHNFLLESSTRLLESYQTSYCLEAENSALRQCSLTATFKLEAKSGKLDGVYFIGLAGAVCMAEDHADTAAEGPTLVASGPRSCS